MLKRITIGNNIYRETRGNIYECFYGKMFALIYYFNSYLESLFTGQEEILSSNKESKYSYVCFIKRTCV